jgi:hypothetical protein
MYDSARHATLRDGAWPILHQRYDTSLGTVEGRIFVRTHGYGGPAGDARPLIYLVASHKAERRGRPATATPYWRNPARKKAYQRQLPHEISAYGLSADGRWWNVLHSPGRADARARSLTKPPYKYLSQGRGKLRNYGRADALLREAQAALLAAELEQARASDPHGLI